MPIRFLLAVGLALAFLPASCGGDDGGKAGRQPAPLAGRLPAANDVIKLTSPKFKAGGTIPELYTCDGVDVPPPLTWKHVPKVARSLALVMVEQDAGDGGKSIVRWTRHDIDPKLGAIDEGYIGKTAYNGPCPPSGDDPHHYVFAVYALKGPSRLDADASPPEVIDKIQKLAEARGTLEATYARAPGQQ